MQQFFYIIKSWPFIIIAVIGLAFLLLTTEVSNQLFGTKTYPLTWQMLLVSGGVFSLFINLLTFLYAGLLVQRAKAARMFQLEDVSPTPNRVFVLSELSALVKMQFVLLALVMLSGMLIQIYNGYYRFEIDLYLFQLYAIEFPRYLAWAMLALFVQHLLKNPWAGFFVLLVLSIGLGFLDAIGIEQALFKFNQGPTPAYSDMNGFGGRLTTFYFYRFYWLMLGGFLLVLSMALYKRGMPMPFKERLKNFLSNYRGKKQWVASLFLLTFIGMGAKIYYENNVVDSYVSAKESEQRIVDYEKTYGKYKNIPQPRIVAVDVDVDIYPKSLDFEAKGSFILTNKHVQSIPEIHVNYNSYLHEFSFDRSGNFTTRDSIHQYAIYRLDEALSPGDSLSFSFSVKNKPNRLLNNNSPVLHNGTFLNSSILPSFGYDERGELTDDKVRKKYDLPPKERFRKPTDPVALQNSYISLDADWIDFKTRVSTDEGQIAIAPGYLTKQWTENGRSYFSYEMDSKMLNFYSWLSADFEVLKDEHQGVAIEIYYQRGHEFNLQRMVEAIKDGLDYYQAEFSPYQHRQVRILEFPRTMGTFAQSFANTIPYSEAIGFIAQVEEDNEDALDYVYSVTAHELAHQWWAHQVIGANAQGSTIMSESASEYSALKVLEHKYGKSQMRKFLKEALDQYLLSRSFESKKEKPLMLVENQPYIHYQKGSLILYGLSDLIGEKTMNKALSSYIDSVAFSGPPYTTSLEFVEFLEASIPDSLQYFIDDGFKNISLYSLKVNDANYRITDSGSYEVDVELQSLKYYNNDQGKRYFSLPGKDSISFTPEDA
ncbi:MAG: M1 family aminopeptidase, partial [Flavobacteriaceae bacterium]|nr:M1 family aminopeptidase [Flavobacteriaceae bacterium]